MKLNEELFLQLASKAAKLPRLRLAYDLRDSSNEGCQRMLNVLQPGTKTQIHRHRNSSETVLCIYGSAIERFYDEDGNETECVIIKAGSTMPGVVVETGRYHSLESTDEIGVVCGFKSGNYEPMADCDIIKE